MGVHIYIYIYVDIKIFTSIGTYEITYSEKRALQELRNNKDIVILPADKGNATVVMNTIDYKEKMTLILNYP